MLGLALSSVAMVTIFFHLLQYREKLKEIDDLLYSKNGFELTKKEWADVEKIIENNKNFDDLMYILQKYKHTKGIPFKAIDLPNTTLLVGYDEYLNPITVDMLRTPHIGIMGLSNMGKSKCAECMLKNLKGARITLVNAFRKDFSSINAKRINGLEEIKNFLQAELKDKSYRKIPHYVVIDECNVLSMETGIDKLIKGLLAQARHFNLYFICILQLANKNDCAYKNLFNTRISFKHIDTDLIKVFVGSSPENILRQQEFFMYSLDYYQGRTYNI